MALRIQAKTTDGPITVNIVVPTYERRDKRIRKILMFAPSRHSTPNVLPLSRAVLHVRRARRENDTTSLAPNGTASVAVAELAVLRGLARFELPLHPLLRYFCRLKPKLTKSILVVLNRPPRTACNIGAFQIRIC